MHPRTLILLALLCAFGTTAQAAGQFHCQSADDGACPPPAPPAPPPLPPIPTPPTPPAPPVPPPLPAVPAAAHAACAGKPAGSVVALTLDTKGAMSGICKREKGRMVFHMRSYRHEG